MQKDKENTFKIEKQNIVNRMKLRMQQIQSQILLN
jgi:hypothetical protein